ncbi:hotdog family protein [Herbidospora sp. RD11066]
MWTPDIRVGTELPPLKLPLRSGQVPSSAQDVQLTLLSTMALVENYVTGWAGTDAFIRGMNVKLGLPAHAGDLLTFTGTVTLSTPEVVAVEVRARLAEGIHATGTVRLSW